MKIRKSFVVLILTILISYGNTFGQIQLPELASYERNQILTETFDNNTNNWITSNQYLTGSIENGKFTIKCNNYQGSTGISYFPFQMDMSGDFEIEASVKIINGSGGLVFGMDDKFNHYRVEFTDKKELFVVKSTSRIDKLYSDNNIEASKDGLDNKIILGRLNNIWYLFLNDIFIRDFNNIKPNGNIIGFSAGVNSEIIVDYLRISSLKKKEFPLIAVKDVTTPDTTSILNQSVINTRQATPQNNALLQQSTPSIVWTSPSAERIQLTEYTARVKATVTTKSRLETVLFYVNGVGVGESEFQPVSGIQGNYIIDKVINLRPGENSVYFVASYEDNNSQKSPVKYFINPQSSTPTLMWISPVENNSSVSTDNILVRGSINSPSGLISAMILVNGVPQVSENNLKNTTVTDGTIEFQKNIILREGENSVFIIATNSSGSTQSDKRIIFYNKAITEKRLALVVGNSDYANGVSLKNPANDANLIEATLEELGFDVIKSLNVDKDSLLNSIREFSRRMSSYNVALFYYAGHGLQIDGVNYLIPVDAKLENKDDCNWEAVTVSTVTDEFKKHSTNTNIVILDACRNNPFRSWVRGAEQGFKAMGPINGTIISYATSEGATAADGTGNNGLYTEELVKQMVIPQQIENVFKNTRKYVMEKSKNEQVPVEWNYLIGDFFFRK